MVKSFEYETEPQQLDKINDKLLCTVHPSWYLRKLQHEKGINNNLILQQDWKD